jgi:hypothetical protein
VQVIDDVFVLADMQGHQLFVRNCFGLNVLRPISIL